MNLLNLLFIHPFRKKKPTCNVHFLTYKHQGLTAQNEFLKYSEKEKRVENYNLIEKYFRVCQWIAYPFTL